LDINAVRSCYNNTHLTEHALTHIQVEGYPLEDFSAEAVRNQIAEEQKIATGGGSEVDVAEAKIALEVLESLQAALK